MSPFSLWVLPLRVFGTLVFLYGLVRLFVAPDITMIVMVIIGSLLWQAAIFAEEHSPLYRRLESTAVTKIARLRSDKVASWTPVSTLQRTRGALGSDAFILAIQDGHAVGVATPEELYSVPEARAQYMTIGQLAHPLSYVHALRLDDSVLDAFARFRRSNDAFIPVVDARHLLAGVVTRHDLNRWLKDDHRYRQRQPATVPVRVSTVGTKIAA